MFSRQYSILVLDSISASLETEILKTWHSVKPTAETMNRDELTEESVEGQGEGAQ